MPCLLLPHVASCYSVTESLQVFTYLLNKAIPGNSTRSSSILSHYFEVTTPTSSRRFVSLIEVRILKFTLYFRYIVLQYNNISDKFKPLWKNKIIQIPPLTRLVRKSIFILYPGVNKINMYELVSCYLIY